MSYNIDNWETKKLVNLVVPLEAFYKHERAGWHPTKPTTFDTDTNEVVLKCGCEQTIKGTLKDGLLSITAFDMAGEGSGRFYNWILEPALNESKGTLEAVIIWEGGDLIQRLKVTDGDVVSEDVEL